jgi:hypothetical protein
MNTTTIKILSWNTLESGNGGAFSMGWGCPLEIQRRDELLKLKQSLTTTNDRNGMNITSMKEEEEAVERILTNERYERIRKNIFNEMEMNNNNDMIDFFLFQEMTVKNSWDKNENENNNENENDNNNKVFPPSSYERVPCQDNNEKENQNQQKNLQRIYVRKQSGWKSKQSVTLESDVLEGGCLAEFQKQNIDDNEEQRLFLVNLHGKSKNMRDPKLRRIGLTDLWNEIGLHLNNNNRNGNENKNNQNNKNKNENDDLWWMKRIVLCGDWNTQLSDLLMISSPEKIQYNNNNNTIPSLLLEPIVGLLHNSTASTKSTKSTVPVFSTNHEDGFLAQYDGCLFFRSNTSTNTSSNNNHTNNDADNNTATATATATVTSSSSVLELDNVSWNITGFMPKGQNGILSSSYNNFTYSRSHQEGGGGGGGGGVYLNGIFLGPGTLPSIGMSDHIRIYTTIRINNNNNNNNNNNSNTVDININSNEHEEHQRRPPRRYESNINSSYDNDNDDY